jgi:hypothetical protein
MTSITQDIYDTKMPLLKQEHTDAKMALDNYDDADDAFKITVSSVLLLLSKAHALFKSSKNDQKRRLINFLFCLAAPCGLAALPPLNSPALRWVH